MAARGSRAGPNRKGRGAGDNSDKADDAIIKKAAESFKDIKTRRAAFNAKMTRRHEKEVSSPLKGIGIKMKHAVAVLENFIIETGTDDDAVKNATNDRALALDTQRRIHAALHDGEQLDFLKLQEQADKARTEAEAEAGEVDEEDDSAED